MCLNLLIVNDTILEFEVEELVVVLDSTDPDTSLGLSQTTVFIMDDDSELVTQGSRIWWYLATALNVGVNVSAQEAVYMEEESLGSVEVCATLSGESDRPVTVHFSTVEDSTAEGQQLYH